MMYAYFIGGATILVSLGLAVAFLYKSRWVRWPLLVFALLAIPASYLAVLDLLSRPKPIEKEYFLIDPKVRVLGYKVKQDVALYLFMDHYNWEYPRYYVIAWHDDIRETIRQLQDGWERSQETGEPLLMLSPFDKSYSEEKSRFAHPDPPKASPPKPEPEEEVIQFQVH